MDHRENNFHMTKTQLASSVNANVESLRFKSAVCFIYYIFNEEKLIIEDPLLQKSHFWCF